MALFGKLVTILDILLYGTQCSTFLWCQIDFPARSDTRYEITHYGFTVANQHLAKEMAFRQILSQLLAFFGIIESSMCFITVHVEPFANLLGG